MKYDEDNVNDGLNFLSKICKKNANDSRFMLGTLKRLKGNNSRYNFNIVNISYNI